MPARKAHKSVIVITNGTAAFDPVYLCGVKRSHTLHLLVRLLNEGDTESLAQLGRVQSVGFQSFVCVPSVLLQKDSSV